MSKYPITDIMDFHGGTIVETTAYFVDDDTIDYMEFIVEFPSQEQGRAFQAQVDPLLSAENPSQHIADGANGESVILFYVD